MNPLEFTIEPEFTITHPMNRLVSENQELKALEEICSALTSSLDLNKNLAVVLNIIAARFHMNQGCVYLSDDKTRAPRLAAALGLTWKQDREERFLVDTDRLYHVIETATPLCIRCKDGDPLLLNQSGGAPKKRDIAYLCIPIAFNATPFGLLIVDRIYHPDYGNLFDDLRVLGKIAEMIARFVQLRLRYADSENACKALRPQIIDQYSYSHLIGESERFHQVIKAVRKSAPSESDILLLGESGTGKEMIARTIHYHSKRASGPFISVDLSTLPKDLIHAALFGIETGAYAEMAPLRIGQIESAHNGTLFLDEIADVPQLIQLELLRVITDGELKRIVSKRSISINVRIIAATARDLSEQIKKGLFREDLYWRLNAVSIVIPSLKERIIDIRPLVHHYLNKFNRRYNKQVKIGNEVISRFLEYWWPGNISELINTVERLVIMTEKNVIQISDLPMEMNSAPDESIQSSQLLSHHHPLEHEVESLEKQRILQALKENNFIQQKAAGALGISTRQIGYRIKKYGIDCKRGKCEE